MSFIMKSYFYHLLCYSFNILKLLVTLFLIRNNFWSMMSSSARFQVVGKIYNLSFWSNWISFFEINTSFLVRVDQMFVL